MEIDTAEEQAAVVEEERDLKRNFEMAALRDSLLSFDEGGLSLLQPHTSKRGRYFHPHHIVVRSVSGMQIRLEFAQSPISVREIKQLLASDHGLVDFRLMARPIPGQDSSLMEMDRTTAGGVGATSKFVSVTNLDDLTFCSGTTLYIVFQLNCRSSGSSTSNG